MDKKFLKQLENQFLIRKIKGVSKIPTGNINSTYKVSAEGARYILQRINKVAFRKPEEVMQNIRRVSRYLEKKVLQEGGNPTREVLHPINTLDGNRFIIDEQDEYWRMYDCIEGAVTYDTIDSDKTFYKVGKAFGRFQNRLIDYPADTLHEAIPDFHNTPKRFLNLLKSMDTDKAGRLKEVKDNPEHPLNLALKYIIDKKDMIGLIEKEKKAGRLPRRVTHNDTKINNVMIDEKTGEPICVIDLDTIGPDSVLVDFGDAIRSGANKAGEEPKKIQEVEMDMKLFKAYTKGYLEETLIIDKSGKINQDPNRGLTQNEIMLLHKAPAILTLELSMRFLEDYLNGDEYFQLREGQSKNHNLMRGLVQLYLAQDMIEKEPQMEETINNIIAEKTKLQTERGEIEW